MKKLKPCQCGSTDLSYNELNGIGKIACNKCGLTTNHLGAVRDEISVWNDRPRESELMQALHDALAHDSSYGDYVLDKYLGEIGNLDRNYNALINACNRAMAEKLWENKHKSGFDEIDIQYAKHRIHEELIELEEAETTAEIRREAADIANFAAMIILKCDKESDA